MIPWECGNPALSEALVFVVGRNSCLIRIAAVHEDSTFSRYVTQLQPISDGAKDATVISYNADSSEMTHSGAKVQLFHPVMFIRFN